MGRIIPCIMENKKCLKSPTRDGFRMYLRMGHPLKNGCLAGKIINVGHVAMRPSSLVWMLCRWFGSSPRPLLFISHDNSTDRGHVGE